MPCSFNEIPSFENSQNSVSVALGYSDLDQVHVGILHKHKDSVKFVHLAWHHILKEDSVETQDYLSAWVNPSIHPIRQQNVADMIRLILRRNKNRGIPYGLKYYDTTFSENGIIQLGGKECGLTCATFVLAVFDSCEIPLINLDTWESRPSDKDWQAEIIRKLETWMKQNLFAEDKIKEHISNLQAEMGSARFRPEEVAVSTLFNPNPSEQQLVFQTAQGLLAKIR